MIFLTDSLYVSLLLVRSDLIRTYVILFVSEIYLRSTGPPFFLAFPTTFV